MFAEEGDLVVGAAERVSLGAKNTRSRAAWEEFGVKIAYRVAAVIAAPRLLFVRNASADAASTARVVTFALGLGTRQSGKRRMRLCRTEEGAAVAPSG